jgi:hypothetical protein
MNQPSQPSSLTSSPASPLGPSTIEAGTKVRVTPEARFMGGEAFRGRVGLVTKCYQRWAPAADEVCVTFGYDEQAHIPTKDLVIVALPARSPEPMRVRLRPIPGLLHTDWHEKTGVVVGLCEKDLVAIRLDGVVVREGEDPHNFTVKRWFVEPETDSDPTSDLPGARFLWACRQQQLGRKVQYLSVDTGEWLVANPLKMRAEDGLGSVWRLFEAAEVPVDEAVALLVRVAASATESVGLAGMSHKIRDSVMRDSRTALARWGKLP